MRKIAFSLAEYSQLLHSFLPTSFQIKPLKRQSRLQQTTFIKKFHRFSEKIRLEISSESSAGQKDKSKKLKCRLLQFSFGAFEG